MAQIWREQCWTLSKAMLSCSEFSIVKKQVIRDCTDLNSTRDSKYMHHLNLKLGMVLGLVNRDKMDKCLFYDWFGFRYYLIYLTIKKNNNLRSDQYYFANIQMTNSYCRPNYKRLQSDFSWPFWWREL